MATLTSTNLPREWQSNTPSCKKSAGGNQGIKLASINRKTPSQGHKLDHLYAHVRSDTCSEHMFECQVSERDRVLLVPVDHTCEIHNPDVEADVKLLDASG